MKEYLAGILKEVKTIAMVGASPDKTKFSYGVLRVLHETGYDMIPVNPREAAQIEEIRGHSRSIHSLSRDRPARRHGSGVPHLRCRSTRIAEGSNRYRRQGAVARKLGVRNDEAAASWRKMPASRS